VRGKDKRKMKDRREAEKARTEGQVTDNKKTEEW